MYPDEADDPTVSALANSVATSNSATDAETWTTISASRAPKLNHRVRAPDTRPFMPSTMASRTTWAAGIRPNSSVAKPAAATANSATRQSTARSTAGMPSGRRASNRRIPAQVAASATAAPAMAINRLSVASWRKIRPRDAPIASRIVSSRVLAAPRASSIVARLTQAMETKAAMAPAALSRMNAAPPCPPANRASISFITVTRRGPPFADVHATGSLLDSCTATPASAASACAAVTPSRSRAKIVKLRCSRSRSAPGDNNDAPASAPIQKSALYSMLVP